MKDGERKKLRIYGSAMKDDRKGRKSLSFVVGQKARFLYYQTYDRPDLRRLRHVEGAAGADYRAAEGVLKRISIFDDRVTFTLYDEEMHNWYHISPYDWCGTKNGGWLCNSIEDAEPIETKKRTTKKRTTKKVKS